MKRALVFKNDSLYYIDQTKLPGSEVIKECMSLKKGFLAIKNLEVRGAPLIGVFAAYCVYIAVRGLKEVDSIKFIKKVESAISYLKASRPTAVNLFWALDKVGEAVRKNSTKDSKSLLKVILGQAKAINKDDIKLCESMGRFGAKLVKDGDRILTHCNAGFLATSGDGTALSVIYQANKALKGIKVYADETRPLLQGSRLTAWELSKRGVDTTLISDNMAAYLMQQKKIDKIFVGADRIASNGDTANKIGTYGVAVLARYHKIPFYIVAPYTTFDLKLKSGIEIPIEEREKDEVRNVLGKVYIAPKKIKVYNPAFDVTPSKLITAIVTDKGVIYPSFKKNIKKIIG